MIEEDFDAFYQASFGRLVGQIYAMCGNVAEAQDCVQEAFVRAWDRRRMLDRDQAPEAWVRTVAYRLAVSRWRRTRKASHPPDRAQAPGRRSSRMSPGSRSPAPSSSCPPTNAGRSFSTTWSICRSPRWPPEVGVPVGTIKARLSRGRAALAVLLTDTEGARHELTTRTTAWAGSTWTSWVGSARSTRSPCRWSRVRRLGQQRRTRRHLLTVGAAVATVVIAAGAAFGSGVLTTDRTPQPAVTPTVVSASPVPNDSSGADPDGDRGPT